MTVQLELRTVKIMRETILARAKKDISEMDLHA